MEYKNFIIRIDDRLIHGQVNVSWIKPLHIKNVYVIDNESYKDAFIVNLWSMSLDDSVDIKVFDLDSFNEKYASLDFNDSLILIKSIAMLYHIVEKIPDLIKTVNIGGLHYEPDKISLFPWFFISKEDIGYLNKLLERGIAIYIQMVPNSQRIDVDKKFIEKIEAIWQKKHA